MQSEFKDLEMSALVDLLAIYTGKYSYMMKAGGSAAKFKKYEELILQLQAEIISRKTREEIQKDPAGDPDIIPALA